MRLQNYFPADKSGAIAVEFALILPVMLLLLFGCNQLARLARISMKLWVASQAISDLVAQQSSVTSAQIQDFCTASTLILAPFPGPVKVTVASVTNTSQGVNQTWGLDWIDTSDCNGSVVPNATALASGYAPNAKDTIIMVRLDYTYAFPDNYLLPNSFAFTKITYSKPRSGSQVTKS